MGIGWQEWLVVLLVMSLCLIAPIIAAIWVYHDAKSRRNDAAAIWTVGTALAWLPVLIVYLIVRPDYREKQQVL